MDTTSPASASAPSPAPLETPRAPAPARRRPSRPRAPRLRRALPAPRLRRILPATCTAVLAYATLLLYGVSATDLTLFTAYLILGLTLPGTLIIRATYPGERTLTEEIALGTALGYALEIFTYIPARATGLPLLVLTWPIATYTLFLTVPRLRKHWNSRPHTPTPTWWSWTLALTCAYLILLSIARFFRGHTLTWPTLATASVDMPFHLALIGELKHHLPPTVPMVDGEPLLYHWFVYTHYAAASWITGIEPLVLLFRLSMLPMMAALTILLAMIAHRLTRSRPAALLAITGSISVGAASLYLGSSELFTWGGIPDASWTSPTQAFGALLFAPVVLLLVDLLDHGHRGAGRWPLLAILLLAIMGAKAVYLPLLAVGLLAVVAVEVIRRRRAPWPALTALGMTVACFLIAQVTLFGQTRQGLIVAPLSFARTAWGELTGLGDQVNPPLVSVLAVASLYLLCWAVAWCGILGLLCRPRLLLRPAVVLLLGMGAAGMGAALLLGHPGRSQLFFLWGAYPYLVIVAVYGILVLLRRARVSRGEAMCAAGAGAVAAYAIPVLCGVKIPLGPGERDAVLHRPYIVLAVAVVLVSAVLVVRCGGLRGWVLVTVMLAAIGLPAYGHARVLSVMDRLIGKSSPAVRPVASPVPLGALEAGRWLRAHSDPGDLVATDAHCRWGYEDPCDSRQSWVAALSERRVLVEGWTYTAANMSHWRPGFPPEHLPFWDGERLALNDAAFRTPSEATIGRLRERYGVRWLFADERRTGRTSRIGDFAELRFRSGDCAVYRIPEHEVSSGAAGDPPGDDASARSSQAARTPSPSGRLT
ncbi:hypothetical protein [Streptosporangium sp. NBC_01469]|uniref:hypothetical protein n=1 Tax=Streptosporangium sp. NBC_01469 TaxID=2903898 RepID=UPI002E298C42|nr:hypothetical protein [Streptosporangium sp. NBC_01469]